MGMLLRLATLRLWDACGHSEGRFTTPIKAAVTFGISLLRGEGTDNEWRQEERREWEKPREALRGRRELKRHV